jgi:glycosidase
MLAWSTHPAICPLPEVVVSAALIALALVLTAAPPVDDGAVVALVMVDRFADGADNADDVVPGHPRRFQGGDLVGLRERLSWLSALGVTHVWLTPLHAQIPHLIGRGEEATAGFHGYWPADFTAVDAHFGTLADLDALASAADDAGIGLILDLVTNHTGYGAPDPRRLVRTRCGDDETTTCIFGLPDLQTEDPRVRAAVVEDAAFWARRVPVAGIRLDAFKHIDRDSARAITAAIHAARPGALVVAERWGAGPGDPAVLDDVAAGAADAAFDFTLMGLAREFVQARLRGVAAAHHLSRRAQAMTSSPPLLTFLDNHDTETWAHAVGPRAPLGAPWLLLTPGIPVITWGTEVGRPGGAGDPANRQMMPWAEAERQAGDPGAPLHFWRRLVALRRQSPAARHGVLDVVAASPTAERSWLIWRRQAEDDVVVVAVSVGAPLLHCAPAEGEVVDAIAWPASSRVREANGRRCLDVAADGALVVRLRATTAATMAP